MFSDSESSEDEDNDAGLAPVRSRFLIRSHRRRDRLVKTIDAALDRANYNLLPEVTEELKHDITVKGMVPYLKVI